MSKTITIIRGIPNSGKTFLAKRLAGYQGINYYESEMFYLLTGAIPGPDTAEQAKDWCQTQVCHEVQQGHDVVVAGLFITIKSLQYYAKLARDYDYTLDIKMCDKEIKDPLKKPSRTSEYIKKQFEYDYDKLLCD